MKQMNCVEISSILCRIVGPLVLGWAPNHFILGTQLAPGEKMLVCVLLYKVVNGFNSAGYTAK